MNSPVYQSKLIFYPVRPQNKCFPPKLDHRPAHIIATLYRQIVTPFQIAFVSDPFHRASYAFRVFAPHIPFTVSAAGEETAVNHQFSCIVVIHSAFNSPPYLPVAAKPY